MKFRNSIKKTMLSIFGIILLAGCSELDNPTGSVVDKVSIKSESKWAVNVNTDTKTHQVYYKEFDNTGNITLNIKYFENGNVNIKSTFEYITEQKSTEQKTQFDEAGNIVDEFTTEYYYSTVGQLEKSVKYSDSGTVENTLNYIYDDLGNVIRKIKTVPGSDTTVSAEYSYRYNNSGNVVERIFDDFDNSQPNIRDSVIYFGSNNKVDVFNYKGNELNTVTSYLYNKYGNIYQEIVSNSNGDIVEKYVYEYTYY